MKVTQVEPVLVAVPMEDYGGAWQFGGDEKMMHCLMVKVSGEGGAVGWGEIFTNNQADDGRIVVGSIAPGVVGRDTSEVVQIKADLEREHHNTGPGGPYAFAIAGVDIALWDLVGQEAGQPIWRMLGGAGTVSVNCYASLTRYGAPDLAAAACARAVADGYRAIKLHEVDPGAVLASRSTVGSDLSLMVDASCAWSLEEAQEGAAAMAEANLSWLEEPIWPPDDAGALAALRQEVTMPLAAGENAGTLLDFRRLLTEHAIDVVQPDLSKGTGVTDALAVARMANASHARTVPHCFVPGPGYVAALHLCAALRPMPMLERFFVDTTSQIMGDAVQPRDGRVRVPTKPGLGCVPDEDTLARSRIA